MKNGGFLSRLVHFFVILLFETLLHFLLLIVFKKVLYPGSDLFAVNPVTDRSNFQNALESALFILFLRLLFFELILKLFFELMQEESKRLFMQLATGFIFMLLFSLFSRNLEFTYESILSNQFFPLFAAMLIVFLVRLSRLVLLKRQSRQ